MIKLMHVLTDTNIGGAGRWLLNYLKSFDRTKFEVTVVLPENAALADKVRDLGIKVIEIPDIADSSFSKQGVKEFDKLFSDEKPDILHTHACLSARIAAKKNKIKTVNTRHCLEEKKSFPKNIIYGIINNSLSDISIGVSQAVVDNLISDGIKKEKVRLVYNGVVPYRIYTDEERTAARAEYGTNENDIVAGIIARLEPIKNHDLFVDAAALVLKDHGNVRFMIVGDGSTLEATKAKVKALGIDDQVIFTGYSDNPEKMTNILDISVLTSVKEACPLSIIEAMTVRKPCVSTDSLGPKEMIEDGTNGYIVPNNDPAALAEKIIKLADDNELRTKMGESGYETAKTKFSLDTMAKELEKIYLELLGKEI